MTSWFDPPPGPGRGSMENTLEECRSPATVIRLAISISGPLLLIKAFWRFSSRADGCGSFASLPEKLGLSRSPRTVNLLKLICP
eukprot:267070-Prorocentrum_minimum.AAC.1